MAQGVGGALEIGAGGATLFTTGLTGVQTAWDGKARHNMISDGIGSAAEWAGASPEMAEAAEGAAETPNEALKISEEEFDFLRKEGSHLHH